MGGVEYTCEGGGILVKLEWLISPEDVVVLMLVTEQSIRDFEERIVIRTCSGRSFCDI